MTYRTNFFRFILLFGLLVLCHTTVHAASYVFSQHGFPDGGFVTGSFSGIDRNGTEYAPPPGYSEPDGLIYSCSGRYCPPGVDEVSAFSIHFGGNPTFESFNDPENSFGLRGLIFDIRSNNLEFSFGTCDTICFPYWVYSTRYGIPNLTPEGWDGSYISATGMVEVSKVPLPGSLGLFLAGFAGLAGIRIGKSVKKFSAFSLDSTVVPVIRG